MDRGRLVPTDETIVFDATDRRPVRHGKRRVIRQQAAE